MFAKQRINSVITILVSIAALVVVPSYAHSEDDVHFGTIFVEDIQYENSDENNFVNSLTDSSQKQLELEKLYKNIGNNNQKLKKMKLDNRRPASVPKGVKDEERIGVIRNSELPQKVIYFLELRSFRGNQATKIYGNPSQTGQSNYSLLPGEIVKIIDTPDQYLHKLRMDRDNQGVWKNISNREEDNPSMYLYYDWRNYYTITPHDMPVEMDIVVPRGRNSIPVFSRPGSWTWKDCGLNDDLCLDQLDLNTKAYLFDTTFVTLSRVRQARQSHRLFYKIGYKVKTKEGKLEHKVGWVSSEFAKRKISQLPKSLLATRNPNGLGTYESDSERLQRLQKYYVFDENMNSANKNLNRWLASAPGRSTEVFYQNVAIDGVVSANSFTLEQNFLSEKFEQYGVSVGLGIFAPIFIDLEVQGTAIATVPVSNETSLESAYLFKGENWLLYTTPISINGLPLKFGLGGYYLTMFASQKSFGFNSLVGFQVKALFENEKFWFGTRYGPTGQDLNFSFENRELGVDLGFRLNPEKKYESWSVYFDLSDVNFINRTSQNRTKFQILNIGLRKQF